MNTPITINQSRMRDLEAARMTEWLVTNGRGGFAMGSVTNLLTRRYHGLLVAAVKPPLDRWVLLAKLDATVIANSERFELSTNDYPSVVHPMGYLFLESFTHSPVPTWRWRLPAAGFRGSSADAVIEQTLFIVPNEDTTYVQWRLIEGPPEVKFEVRPLCTSRFMHDLLERGDLGEPTIDERPSGFSLRWKNRPVMHLDSNGAFSALPDWYYHFVLTTEAKRGQNDRQDLFMPGPIRTTLRKGDSAGLVIVASTAPAKWTDWNIQKDRAATHRMRTPLPESITDPLAQALARATDVFIVDRGKKKTVIAGYPWFGDWGRDTFISLPGLCLVTGRFDVARQIIDTFIEYVKDGLVPNRFPDVGEQPEYNTVDASLWFIHAIDRYLAYSGDWEFVQTRCVPVITKILNAHVNGTRHRIKLDADGLLAAGEPGVQLTWMDAKCGDWVVTPRVGKPVEINALWYNGLRIAAEYATRMNDTKQAARWNELADRCRESFNRRFWNEALGCLDDVVDNNHATGKDDPSIRPNQLLAISLTHPILDQSRWESVVRVCREKLHTPLGMRTLDPAHPDYKPFYFGDLRNRDAAYHQGTVWAWLLGPFITAYVRSHDSTPQARAEARRLLAGLEAHLADAGIENVSEIAEAQAPHRPEGCPWQAWSVAEPLRALVEDVLGIPPGKVGQPVASVAGGATTKSKATHTTSGTKSTASRKKKGGDVTVS